jgi:hypothetical protein
MPRVGKWIINVSVSSNRIAAICRNNLPPLPQARRALQSELVAKVDQLTKVTGLRAQWKFETRPFLYG